MIGKKGVIITLITIGLLFVGLLVGNYFLSQIPKNSPGTVGNSAGNLNNGGYFCEAEDGTVYFGNAYDYGSLYCMNVDETNIRKIGSAEVQYLNQAGKYLYYYQKDSQGASSLGFVVHMSGLYRCLKNGDKILCLDKSSCNTVALVDNTLFYEKAVKASTDLPRTLYQIDIDKKNALETLHAMVIPSCASNSGFYYNGTTEDHYLYYYNSITRSSNLIAEYNMWFPTLCDNYIYFMDLDNNYRLCRYSIASGQMDVLTTDRVDCFNVYGSYVYYQKNDKNDPALMRMFIDGSNVEVVATGNFSDINITSQYVYFHAFGANEPVYHTPTSGPVAVSNFDGARTAAMKEMSK